LPVALVDHDQVDDRVVDLHLLQRRGHGRRLAADTLQVAGRILAFPAASDLARIEAGDPQATVLRAGTRSFCACKPARPRGGTPPGYASAWSGTAFAATRG
jgi:hypothetical protein